MSHLGSGGLERSDPSGQKGLVAGLSSQVQKEFINRESDIFRYLSEQDRRYVPAAVERHRRATSICFGLRTGALAMVRRPLHSERRRIRLPGLVLHPRGASQLLL